MTKLGYLTPVPRFEKYQLAPSAMALGYVEDNSSSIVQQPYAFSKTFLTYED